MELIWIDRLRRINRWVALATGAMLLACAAFVLADIILRRLGSSLGGTDEIAGYAMAIGTAWGMSYTLLELGHVRIDLLRSRGGTGLKAVADIFSMVVLTATVTFIAIQAWPVVERSQIPWFAGWIWFATVSALVTCLALSMVLRGRAEETEAIIGAFAEQEMLQ